MSSNQLLKGIPVLDWIVRSALGTQNQRMVKRYLKQAPPEVLAPFAFNGLWKVRHWLERPPHSYSLPRKRSRRREYTEDQLYIGLCRMRTPRKLRAALPE